MPSLAKRAATVLLGMTACCLVACGHTKPDESEGAPPLRERVRPELGCTERPTADDDETQRCAAQGCQWGPALVCSGVERPPPPKRRDDPDLVPAPSCACVCPEDIRNCPLWP